jgi:hypothetical protein
MLPRANIHGLDDVCDIILDVVPRDARVTNAKLKAEVGCRSERTIQTHLSHLIAGGAISVAFDCGGRRSITVCNAATSTDVDLPDNVVRLASPVSTEGFASEARWSNAQRHAEIMRVLTEVVLPTWKLTNHKTDEFPLCLVCGEPIQVERGESVVDDSTEPWKWLGYRHLFGWQCNSEERT